MRRSLLALLIALLLAGPSLAAGPRPGPGPGFGDLVDFPALAVYLELTPEQIDATAELRQALADATQPIRIGIRELEEELQGLLNGEDPVPSEVGEIVITIHEDRQLLVALQSQFELDFVALLTPDQVADYDTMKEVLRVVIWSLNHEPPPPPAPEG